MNTTPVFDATVKASDPDLHKASSIFPQPSTHWSFAADRYVAKATADGYLSHPWALTDQRYSAKVTGEFPIAQYVADGLGVPLIVTSKPEPKWRTFLRCLL